MKAKTTVFKYVDGVLSTYEEDNGELAAWVLRAAIWLKESYKVQGWKDIKEPVDVVQEVMDSFYFMWVGSTFVAFSVEQPWFSNSTVVAEEFVVPFGSTPKLADVVAALTVAGQAAGATRLVIGTRAAPRGKHAALARMYNRQGLASSAMELTKEI